MYIGSTVRKRQGPPFQIWHTTTTWHSAAVEVDEIVRASRLPAAIAFVCVPDDHSFDLELAACVLLTSLS